MLIFIALGQPLPDLSYDTIYKWIKQLSSVKISENEEITAKEHQAMKKRIAELELENEILKKATAIFARKR